jgi:membrane-bound inhibitor of C-type lysozyme
MRATATAIFVPLQTRSLVLTWLPSSMVCKLKSISGSGFFSWTARMALSMYLAWSKGC